MDDVREMLIQHILTEDIFNTIFDETAFHRENNIARELTDVIDTFFKGAVRHDTFRSVRHYYKAIQAAAASIADHHEKQKFLKVIYETFYKSYNPKAADRLGVVYTPNEIVRFMIVNTDYLLHKHFNKSLEDKGVEILDPATGTGTFITELIDYLDKDKVKYKYENELHANEVAILPYYIANLNIEFTYSQRMGGKYTEFKNLCFVDTLDNMDFGFEGKQTDLFKLSSENTERIQQQNERKISIIIGNPPYNANQASENDNNKNLTYPDLDKLISETFVKHSTAQKTKVYDMYARFYRWAFTRLHNNGIVAFVTNRSFIESRTFDGFRKTIQDECDFAYIIDTRSDVRANPKISGTGHNVFGIQTGVALMFLIKLEDHIHQPCEIQYMSLDDFWKKEEKIRWFRKHILDKDFLFERPKKLDWFIQSVLEVEDMEGDVLTDISLERICPDGNNNWINLPENEWEDLLPTISYDVKNSAANKAIFKIFSNGIATNRDAWVYDDNLDNLGRKINYFIDEYNGLVDKLEKGQFNGNYPDAIKWSHGLKNKFRNRKRLIYNPSKITSIYYRPFKKRYYYCDFDLSDLITSTHFEISGDNLNAYNQMIWFKCGFSSYFFSLGINKVHDIMPNGGSKCLPRYRYDKAGNRTDNITDWGLQQFQTHYQDTAITKEQIFHYVYAVLHHPAYLTKYELNLKREFPRIPFYDNFTQWATWGAQLMDLHIGYETAAPYDLQKKEVQHILWPKAKLKADKENGTIIIDENTTLLGIPADAWTYKLGNRSALEWVLDQYKESKPKDPTIAKEFNNYRFDDYKDQVIELLKKVCTVSVHTMKIVTAMETVCMLETTT